ncbi:MAG: transposase [Rhodobacteraceae bacterium]|nr:transposase [Paracoccaceae bacterium]
MTSDTVTPLDSPAESSGDALTEVLRQGARNLLPVAIEAAVSEFLRAHEARVDDQGRRRRVRHGHLPERDIMTGIGTVAVRVPKIRDRGMNPDGDRIRFSSRIVPPDLRKTKSVEELIPWLYLKGISTGDFGDALTALLGPDAPGISATTIGRMTRAWTQEHEIWRQRDLLRDRPSRGFTAPRLAIGDGALGVWTALRDVGPTTREPRCRVHKTAHVTHALPKSRHDTAKSNLQDIGMAETQTEAEAALDVFVKSDGRKDSTVVGQLTPNTDELFALTDFPAEHGKQIRTPNPVESVFRAVRNRTRKTRGSRSRKTARVMVDKLMMSAKSKWRRPSGSEHLADIIKGVEFQDGIRQFQDAA